MKKNTINSCVKVLLFTFFLAVLSCGVEPLQDDLANKSGDPDKEKPEKPDKPNNKPDSLNIVKGPDKKPDTPKGPDKNPNNGDISSSECSTTGSTDLYAGQHILVGNVDVSVNGDNYTITYNITNNDYCLTATHLSVVKSPDSFPLSGGGTPKNGHFEYKENHDCVSSFSYTVPTSKGTYIAAHAVVNCTSNDDDIRDNNNTITDDTSTNNTDGDPNRLSGDCEEETAWAKGCSFPGKNWSSYFHFSDGTVDDDPVVDDPVVDDPVVDDPNNDGDPN